MLVQRSTKMAVFGQLYVLSVNYFIDWKQKFAENGQMNLQILISFTEANFEIMNGIKELTLPDNLTSRYAKLTDRGLVSMTSSNLRVGDIVVVEKGVRVPADLVLLRYKPRAGLPRRKKTNPKTRQKNK